MGFSFGYSKKKIDTLLKEIDERYEEYAKRYGVRFFNYHSFKDRYFNFLKTKNDLALFLKQELEFLEKQKSMLEEKKQTIKAVNNKMDEITEVIINQMNDYPEEFIDEKATLEIKKIVGTCRDIYPKIMDLQTIIPLGLYTHFVTCTKVLKGTFSDPYSPTYKDYMETIRSSAMVSSRIDSIGQLLIKEIAVSLKTIRNIFFQCEDQNQVTHIVDYIDQIIRDFRLEIFKPLF